MLPIGCRACRGFDHGWCLHVCQFFDTPLSGHYVTHFQRQICVFMFLPYLQAGQMRISQFHFVFIQEVFCYSTFYSLSIFQLKRESEINNKKNYYKFTQKISLKITAVSYFYLRLHLCRSTSNITYSVFSFHGTAVCDFNFQAFNFFCKLNSLRICQWLSLIIDVPNIKNFTHELYNWLSFIKCSCRDWNVINK